MPEYQTQDNYQLPTRGKNIYLEIENYEKNYEYTHKIVYEFARRNPNVTNTLNFLFELFNIYEIRIFPRLVEYKTIDNLSKEEIYKDIENAFEKNYIELFKHYKKEEFINIIENLNFNNIEPKLSKIVNSLTDKLYEQYYIIYQHNEIIKNDYPEIYDARIYSKKEKTLLKPIETHFEDPEIYNNNSYTYNAGDESIYTFYQAVDMINKTVIFNTIYPKFSTAIRDFSDTQIILNINLPMNEIIDYIQKIKSDYNAEESKIMTPKKLLKDDYFEVEENMPLSDSKKLADMFFIYDYYSLSKIFEKKQESEIEKEIQRELTKFHGLKVKKEKHEIKNSKDTKYKLVPMDENFKNDSDIDFYEIDDEKGYLSTKSISDKYKLISKYIEGDNPKYKAIINK